jgi:hypothetical protein
VMCDAVTQHHFSNKHTMYTGRAPTTEADTLLNILTMYRKIKYRDHIVTLNLLAAELKRLDRYIQVLSLAAIWHHMWCLIRNHGIVLHHLRDAAKKHTMSRAEFQVGYIIPTNLSRLVITMHLMWSTCMRPTSTLTLHPEQHLLGVANK